MIGFMTRPLHSYGIHGVVMILYLIKWWWSTIVTGSRNTDIDINTYWLCMCSNRSYCITISNSVCQSMNYIIKKLQLLE